MDQLYQGYKSDLMTTTSTTTTTGGNNNVRHLRAPSRELLTWCQTYCPGQCSWCKTNDIFFGQNCNNFCRRREEEAEVRDLQTTDGFASYPSNMTLFTAQQKKDCTLILASLVRSTMGSRAVGGSTNFICKYCLFLAATNKYYTFFLFDAGISCRRYQCGHDFL
jgi:hypothetical protein